MNECIITFRRHELRSDSLSAYAYGGLVYSSAYNVSSYSNTSNGARLAFKSKELAIYAGQQFGELWASFLIG